MAETIIRHNLVDVRVDLPGLHTTNSRAHIGAGN